MSTTDAKQQRKSKPAYAASCLALSTLAVICYLLGSLNKLSSSASQLEDSAAAATKSITWISKKCKSAPTPLDVTKVDKQTVLVTGAASPVGYHVAKYCSEVLGMKVIAVDESPAVPAFTSNSTRFVKGSLQDEAFVNDLFTWYKFSVVYHLAEYGSSEMSNYLPAFNYKANLVAPVHVLNGAIRTHVKTFVYLSSTAVYGSPGPVYSESVSPDPADPFGVAKAAMETQVQLASKIYGINYVILRAGQWFGPGVVQNAPASSLLVTLMMQAKKGSALIVPREVTQTLSATYVKDIAPLLAESALIKSTENEIINVGSDRVVTYGDVTQLLASYYDGDLSIGYARPQDAKARAAKQMKADYTKMQCIFGLRDETPLPLAVNETVSWLNANTAESGSAQQAAAQQELMSFQHSSTVQPGVVQETDGTV